jgi:uncharacterized protein with GYD domain
MGTYLMLTRVDPEALRSPQSLEGLEKRAMEAIAAQCPEVKWIASYAVFGPYDYVDVFEAPANESAAKVSTLIRTSGRAHCEVWPAFEWARFKQLLHGLKA